MPTIDFGKRNSRYNVLNFFKALNTTEPIGKISYPRNHKIEKINSGKAEGIIIGGNLSLMAKLVGSEYLPSFKDRIVFFEDIGENPERVDGYLAQLFLSTDFRKAKGYIVGEFSDSSYKEKSKKSWTVKKVIKDYFSRSGKPVIYGFPCGHGNEKITIPVGIKVLLDADRKKVVFNEAGVK
jgi:muramoyltetrapeptide carboxypeptidase